MLTRSNLHQYQERAINHIKTIDKSALFLDLGLGKTVTTLTAINDLIKDFAVGKVLIIAPLRVAQTVWHTEAKNWEHLKHMTFSLVIGKEVDRRAALQRTADVYVINRENVPWLVEKMKRKWPFDTVVIDESSSFKNSQSKRFRALKKVSQDIRRMVQLTGTPTPNGAMDLFAQLYLLDGGLRLGRTLTNFRNRFFDAGYMGYTYTLRDGALFTIQKNISDICLSMSAEDYLDLPDKISIIRDNKLEGKLLSQYREFEKHMLLEIGDDVELTAVSAATLSNKLLQFCSGNIYDEDRNVHHFHDLKIETLKEIVEDNQNENMIVVYNFKHELETLRKAFPKAEVMDKAGANVERWNNGEIQMLLLHPKSAGHGLNLQKGGSLMVWYGVTWSLEEYQQMFGRLHRQGQSKPVRVIHIAVGEIEHRVFKALSEKKKVQDVLLSYLK